MLRTRDRSRTGDRWEGLREPHAPDGLGGAPRIWAVGGGKGGVGKSAVATTLAAAMAGMGRRCTIVDADLGGANLHTLLGVPRPPRTLSHFLNGEVGSLAELQVATSVPRLSLVSGNEALVETANPGHCQKQKLFRQIRALDVDEVVLDLGAGSAFNTLDTFLLAGRGVLVVTPEPTAIENGEHFLRAAFHRSLRNVARRPEVRAALLRLREDPQRPRFGSAPELIARVERIDPLAAKLLDECASAFRPLILVNQVETREQRRVGTASAERWSERLGACIESAGCIDWDPRVREAVAGRRPVYQQFSNCAFSKQVEALAERLLRDPWELPEAGPRRNSVAPDRRIVSCGAPLPGVAPSPRATLPSLEGQAPGAFLRLCRESLGSSLDEMTERTRIQGLANIEAECFDRLPPEPYLKGFVLEYARELGVEELETLTHRYLERYRHSQGDAAH